MNGFEKRAEQKKQLVLAAAFQLLNTPAGRSAVTTEEIVKASGVSKATIFKYFGSKDKLFQQVYLDFLDRMGDRALAYMDQPLDFQEKLWAMSQVKIATLEEVDHQFYVDLMDYYTQTSDQELAAKMATYTKRSQDTMLDLLHQGRKEGLIDLKYSDEFLMLYIQAMVEGISSPEIYPKINIHYTKEWSEMLMKSLAPGKTGVEGQNH